jgi:predicted Holliday junction resolvase-like endonuclease
MRAGIGEIFGALAHLMGVCPCCGELFYVSEAHPYYEGHKPHSSLDKLRAEQSRLEEAEQRLDDLEGELRERAARAGLRATKRLLRKIDPTFSGSGYDPQDVKVIFNPVTFVVFNGMSQRELKSIQLLTMPPQNQASEQVQSSIEQAVSRGNIEFRILRVDDRGAVAGNVFEAAGVGVSIAPRG